MWKYASHFDPRGFAQAGCFGQHFESAFFAGKMKFFMEKIFDVGFVRGAI